MIRWQVSGRTILLLGILLWLLGLATIWCAVPIGPREGWQPPRDEFICGMLKDGPTMVTVPRTPSGTRVSGTTESGPVRLWNITTGELRAEHFSQKDVFDRVMVEDRPGLLRIQQPVEGAPHRYRLRLLEPLTGRQVAEFACHVPQDNVWWVVAPDGKTTAFATFEGQKGRIEWWDIGANKLIRTLEGVREPICFSPDGARFAASSDKEDKDIVVFEVPSGKELRRLPATSKPNDPAWVKQFSADNRFLLDGDCQVWDVATGKLHFQVPGIYYNSSLFSPDGKYLIVVAKSADQSWVAYYDLESGQELSERRVPLVTGTSPGMHLGPATDDFRMLMATGTPRIEPPGPIFSQLARIPGLSWLSRQRVYDAFVLIDTDSCREVMRGGSDAWSCTPGGKYLISRSRDEVYELWDIPPRKPLRWLLPSAGGWTLFVGLLVGWKLLPRFRRPPVAAAAIPLPPGT